MRANRPESNARSDSPSTYHALGGTSARFWRASWPLSRIRVEDDGIFIEPSIRLLRWLFHPEVHLPYDALTRIVRVRSAMAAGLRFEGERHPGITFWMAERHRVAIEKILSLKGFDIEQGGFQW